MAKGIFSFSNTSRRSLKSFCYLAERPFLCFKIALKEEYFDSSAPRLLKAVYKQLIKPKNAVQHLAVISKHLQPELGELLWCVFLFSLSQFFFQNIGVM